VYPACVHLDPVAYVEGRLRVLDQRALPNQQIWLDLRTWQQVAEAIETMAVRGAPLIGVAAAYALAMAHKTGQIDEAARALERTRPTAVNLFHAIRRVENAPDPLAEAHAIKNEEIAANQAIGNFGASLLAKPSIIITICSTGSLAAPGIGTALGIIKTAFRKSLLKEAILLETRPRLQGLKLNAWELSQEQIPFRVITDGAAAAFMNAHSVDMVVAGADRIAANGDTANKIGTFTLAALSDIFKIPFVIAAPTSTIDSTIPSGEQIPIEQRADSEIVEIAQTRIAPENVRVWNPAFDVTPARLISRIVTERGVFAPPYDFGPIGSSAET
jgi:methylthioribose-1-phosphate isomerase